MCIYIYIYICIPPAEAVHGSALTGSLQISRFSSLVLLLYCLTLYYYHYHYSYCYYYYYCYYSSIVMLLFISLRQSLNAISSFLHVGRKSMQKSCKSMFSTTEAVPARLRRPGGRAGPRRRRRRQHPGSGQMCVCIYIYIYIYIHTHIQIRVHIYIYIYIYIYLSIYLSLSLYLCVYISLSIYIHRYINKIAHQGGRGNNIMFITTQHMTKQTTNHHKH